MEIASLTKQVTYHETRPTIQVLMETETGKEIRIAFKKGQIMKEHQTPFPIVVEIFEGNINFGVNGVIHSLGKGDLISLEGSAPHDLTATEDSIVRLSLNKGDTVKRVEKIAKKL